MCETQKKTEKWKHAAQLRLCISIRCARFQNLLKPQHTDTQTHSRQECMTAHKRCREPNWGGLWEQISQMEKGWRKERKKGLETAIFLCEPPARINANSLILLPLFLVFSLPSISRFSPLASPPHCALILLFSYHAVLPAHIVFISFVYLVSHFLKGRACASQKSATSCFLSLPLSFSILASLACVFFFFFFFMSNSRAVFLTDHIFAYLVNDNPPRF